MPETAWKDGAVDLTGLETAFKTVGSDQDLPASADLYTLPEIEGFDHEKAAASPIVQVMRAAAHAAGKGQAFFETQIKGYIDAAKTAEEAATAAEMAKLGSTAAKRIEGVADWLNKSLPAPLYEAMRGVATSAAVIEAIEKLMAKGGAAPAPRSGGEPAPQRKTKAEINAIMASKAYSGKDSERDPKVIAEVEEWFKAEYPD